MKTKSNIDMLVVVRSFIYFFFNCQCSLIKDENYNDMQDNITYNHLLIDFLSFYLFIYLFLSYFER